jgi:glycosyltransferase
MLVSVITAVLNAADTIEDCIRSVQSQTYNNIEHIVLDGGSTDGTREIIQKYRDKLSKVVSEPDKGMYDAINKGLRFAKGEIICILNSDDFYAHEKVLEGVVNVFKKYNVDSCYGDLVYVDKKDTTKVIRYWKSNQYRDGMMRYGWHPPHPAFFVKKEIYEKFGYFNTDFKIASDYEIMLRFLEKYKISTYYIPEVLVKMRIGGKSNKNLKNVLTVTIEEYRAWKINGFKNGFLPALLIKMRKIPQFFLKP